jgi:hypothetical protein
MSPLFFLGKALESPSTKSSFYYQWLTKENGEEKSDELLKTRELSHLLWMLKYF